MPPRSTLQINDNIMGKKKTSLEDAVIKTLTEFDQTKYIKEFNKKTYKDYKLRVRRDNVKVIEKLEQQDSINGYIIKLIGLTTAGIPSLVKQRPAE